MKTTRIIAAKMLILCITATAVFAEQLAQQDKDFTERQERHLQTIAKYSTESSPEAIEKLGEILGRLSNDGEPELRESEAFKLARARLLEIPGFAEYYEQKILATSAWENGESNVQMPNKRGWFFRILRQLPHPETIRVLGDLLQDDRDPTNGAKSDSNYIPNSVNAVYSLHGIGLQKPPVSSRYSDAWNDFPTWRLWYEQVQHGKPFSFEGNPKTYTLAEKSQATVTRKERRPRAGEGETANDTGGRASKPALLVLLGILLLTVTVAASKLLRKPGKL